MRVTVRGLLLLTTACALIAALIAAFGMFASSDPNVVAEARVRLALFVFLAAAGLTTLFGATASRLSVEGWGPTGFIFLIPIVVAVLLLAHWAVNW